jgi:hypothetical protein
MLIFSWIAAIVVAAVHLITGIMKLPKASGRLPRNQEVALGVVEILGAGGLIAPALTGIAVWLTPVTALCFAVLQVGAFIFSFRHRDFKVLPVNVTLIALALFVAWFWFTR